VKMFHLFGVTVTVSAGLCAAAVALSPGAAAAPLPMGGPTCVDQMAGPVAAAPPPVPMALPGPLPGAGGPPAGAPVLPDAPVVPASAPVAGKGVPTDPGPALTAFPEIRPGPPPLPAPPPPAPGPVLVSAIEPLPTCCKP
jgi:hypothetical protein